MDQSAGEFTLSLHHAIAEIGPRDWNSLDGSANPFVSAAFLAALEESGSVGPKTGWYPQHAALRDPSGALAAAAPAYVKTHSYGEYVFDHAWANAMERAGEHYYPKLQIAVPFSPVPGPRLLCRPGIPVAGLGQGLIEATRSLGCSSAHVTFCTEAEWRALGAAGWLTRLGTQYHWENDGYADFDAFLAALNARKRKAIRRERREAQAGLEIRALRGPEIGRAEWRAFYQFYLSTVNQKWGGAYLTKTFFPALGAALGERVVLMMAYRAGKPIAGALNLMGADALYGRNWGAIEEIPFLHFELCYYQAIDFAIRQGLKRVEAGAQGQHKIQRGYLPKPTYSAHWISHPGLREAVAGFLAHERQAMEVEMAELAEASPFRQVEEPPER